MTRVRNTKAWKEMQLAGSLTEIEDVVKRNFREMIEATHWGRDDFAIQALVLNKFEITDLYTDKQGCVSNSHHAPRGKKTNWGGWEEDLPRGYPGVSAVITWQMCNVPVDRGLEDIKLERALGPYGIHTGTGGGRSRGNYQFSGELFYEDFPALEAKIQGYQKLVKQAEFKAKLANKRCTKSLIDMII